MSLRNSLKDPKRLMVIGQAALAVSLVAGYFLHRGGASPGALADGLWGFLLGISIGMLLVALYRRNRTTGGGSGYAS